MNELLSPILYQLGAGGILGFAVGYAIKKVLKALALIMGFFALALIYLGYIDIISVNYTKLTELVEGLISSLGESSQWLSPIIASLPFAGSFILGITLGLKKG